MGIVSSTFLSLSIQFAWNFQRFLDPRYRNIEPKTVPEPPSPHKVQPEGPTIEDVSEPVVGAEECTSTHQENRNRRAAQRRYRRKRPSSFDASLIVTNVSKTGITATRVVSSTPSTLTRQQAPAWDDSSASTTSSSEDSDLDVRPDKIGSIDTRNAQASRAKEGSEEYAMSAAEEAAFRMTVGRGHFSRSKKDKFLNHLRLEKRLNGLNREFFELACRAHSRTQVDITPTI
ncbi:uncharacterized protein LOC107035664 isoform X2 [Diachasma alloeum]|uniref:uncharacterized protein LOC107035664 isoform X2 n=1 Tax=Diachasma alloeum TaxID=454923 RepID=UPI0007381E67|nr:uncharacterized protein LOC107035664 isoform X2 [Diachasma alloeum]